MDHSSGIRLPEDAKLDKKRKINDVIICIHHRDVIVKLFSVVRIFLLRLDTGPSFMLISSLILEIL